MRTLLPKINESNDRQNKSNEHVKPEFNDEDELHYILLGGRQFKKGKQVELFMDYGESYDAIWRRKYGKNNNVVPAFYDISRSIATYTEKDVLDVLSFFARNPPKPSEARY